MRTSLKIAIARVMQATLTLPRRVMGRGTTAIVRRGGHRWQLDLSEGIDFSIWMLGSFEPRTVALYRRQVRPGAVVLDIGANIGAHTIPLAGLVGPHGHVHAFEATEWAFAKLQRNVSANPELASRVTANHCFLTDGSTRQAQEQAIYASWPLESVKDLHPEHRGQLKPIGQARRTSLDAYAAEHGIATVDFVKIDVDGNELTVLKGGRELITRLRPPMVIELAPYLCREGGESFAEFIELLRAMGYRQAQVIGTRARYPLDASVLDAAIAVGASINTLLTA